MKKIYQLSILLFIVQFFTLSSREALASANDNSQWQGSWYEHWRLPNDYQDYKNPLGYSSCWNVRIDFKHQADAQLKFQELCYRTNPVYGWKLLMIRRGVIENSASDNNENHWKRFFDHHWLNSLGNMYSDNLKILAESNSDKDPSNKVKWRIVVNSTKNKVWILSQYEELDKEVMSELEAVFLKFKLPWSRMLYRRKNMAWKNSDNVITKCHTHFGRQWCNEKDF